MKKVILSFLSLALLAIANSANAVTVTLIAHNQRSSSGTLSTLSWRDCGTGVYSVGSGCVNPTTAWATANGVFGSTATWDWDPVTGVMTSTGTFQSTSHLSSNPSGSSVISDKTVNMVIDTANSLTTATSYNCVEGTFLAGVGANGCLNTSTGGNFSNESSAAYNVGGNANCVNRTIGGDDSSTGNPRGLMNAAAGGGCDAVDGAWNVWTVSQSGGQLILSNGVPLANAGTNYLTFVPVPAAVWLFGSALGLLGWVRRRAGMTA